MSEETSECYALYSMEELTRLLYWLQHCRDGQLRHLPDLVAEVRAEITQRRRNPTTGRAPSRQAPGRSQA